eukprot:gene40605-53704_t
MKQDPRAPGHDGKLSDAERDRRERVGDGHASALRNQTAGELQRIDHHLRMEGAALGREHRLYIVAQLRVGAEHDHALRREIAGAERFPAGEGMPGGQDDDSRQVEQWLGIDPGIVQRQRADPEIERLVGHRQFEFAAMDDRDLDLDLGMKTMKVRHGRRQQAGGEARHAHDPQADPRAARHALGDAGQVVDRHEHAPHLGEEGLAVDRLGAGGADDVLRQHVETGWPRRIAVEFARLDGLQRGQRFQHLEPVGRRDHG